MAYYHKVEIGLVRLGKKKAEKGQFPNFGAAFFNFSTLVSGLGPRPVDTTLTLCPQEFLKQIKGGGGRRP